MKLGEEPFMKIKNGEKVIESRLFDEKRSAISIGDEIEFTPNDDQTETVLTKVVALYRYQTFEELLSDFPSSLFGGGSKEELLKELEEFYSGKEQEKYGVIGIKIRLI
jgi:ASC-1-like (ASCH) protein